MILQHPRLPTVVVEVAVDDALAWLAQGWIDPHPAPEPDPVIESEPDPAEDEFPDLD